MNTTSTLVICMSTILINGQTIFSNKYINSWGGVFKTININNPLTILYKSFFLCFGYPSPGRSYRILLVLPPSQPEGAQLNHQGAPLYKSLIIWKNYWKWSAQVNWKKHSLHFFFFLEKRVNLVFKLSNYLKESLIIFLNYKLFHINTLI